MAAAWKSVWEEANILALAGGLRVGGGAGVNFFAVDGKDRCKKGCCLSLILC